MLPKKLIGVRVGKRPFNLPSLGGPQRAVRGDGCLPNLAANDPAQVFPGGPVVKTPSSNAGGGDLIPGQRTKIPYVLRSKNQNIKQKHSIMTLKTGPHQKIKQKNGPVQGPRWAQGKAWHEVGLAKCWINQPVSGSLPRNSPHLLPQ